MPLALWIDWESVYRVGIFLSHGVLDVHCVRTVLGP